MLFRSESLAKLGLLHKMVVAQCDLDDGVKDGIIDDPLRCDFDPARDLAPLMCANDVNGPGCFTRRQVEVLRLAARGLTTQQIADRLSISSKTADHHIQNIYAKTGVRGRTAIALFAIEHGIVLD